MKPLKHYRIDLDLKINPISSSIKYFKKLNIDFDVYLPTYGCNLQRDFVWSLEQKRELIWSILVGRHIPHLAFINSIGKNNEDLYLVIDGKQRLSAIFDFVDDKFSIVIDGEEFLHSQLPKDYVDEINRFYFGYYVCNEPWDNRITDDQKVAWFKFINFAGTPQDIEHLKKFDK